MQHLCRNQLYLTLLLPTLTPFHPFLTPAVPAKPGFVPLSPGPEKAKLHMDAVASLLGLSSVDKQQAAAANAAPQTAVTTVPEPALEQWTILPSSRPGAPLRAAKRLSSSEIYSRSLTIPRSIFESLFGKQSSTSTTALVEPSAGALLALAAEAASGNYGSPAAHFSLRAGPLVNALRATAGDVIILTALDTETAAAGTPPRARASVGYPTDVPSSGNAAANGANNINNNHPIVTALAYGHESRSASGSPGSLDSLTHALSDGVNDGIEDEPSNAYAAAATLTTNDRLGSSDALDGMEDPEWQHGSGNGGSGSGSIRTRGRPRKRRPYGSVGGGSGAGSGHGGSQRAAAAAAAVNLSCSHCGTRETPRWWKDAFPLGTLCNACGIWLKRHGYPRPVQFFSVPSANPGAGAAAAAAAAVANANGQHHHVVGSQQAPSPGEFYLINGRPKRRRAAMNSTFGRGDGDHLEGTAMAAAMVAAAAHSDAHDAAINYQAAGGRVFVMRRKLITNLDDGIVIAALVHFGWAPGARAAHEMFEKVSSYGTGSNAITVEDFELLGDTKATATLTLRADVGEDAPEDWDLVVCDFIESL
jgi:GATA zinc finger